ncbi:hydroxysqualene dehydroxylase [Spirosoma panaciterrae]|uniref:hydroxysqualene dehydroxylase n=1 Tax=Spirosoma panaciterrae TaxID=496058 RepID=UPI0003608475|nr:FAD-dependent oxidoreductase [Spirosoma panaciterrae]
MKVIVLGGGVAGMSAAHELIERGFSVDIYEKKPYYMGGKARSVNVPGSSPDDPNGQHSTGPGADVQSLPGEHGFRFFPGFYRHITDTMQRIPYTAPDGKKNAQGVYNNLVDVTRVGILRNGKKPIITIVSFPKSLADLKAALEVLHTHDTGLLPDEAHFFATKVWQLMTSCQRRRDMEYEKTGWWQYMEADQHSEAYRHLLVEGLTRTLVAANAKFASTKTGGDIFIQLLFNIANPGMHTDRVLNGPTNEKWLKPWEEYLTAKGVRFFKSALVQQINCVNGTVQSVDIQNWEKDAPYDPPAKGDYYILATPVEVAAAVLPDELKQSIGSLQYLDDLAADVAWMNGIQFYLNQVIEVVHGHCIYVDSEWALTSISQLPFWDDYDISRRGNKRVKAILSVDISDWLTDSPDLPGLPPKKAKDCQSFDEIADRVWAQLKRSLNVDGTIVLSDEMREGVFRENDLVYRGYFLDHSLNEQAPPGKRDPTASVVGQKGQKGEVLINHEPLLVNTVNSWFKRPSAYIPGLSNLFLASDYVRTNTDLATMEGANEAARRAVNSIIDVSGVDAPLCSVWNLHEPVFFAPFKWYDNWRFGRGLPYKKTPGWFDALMVIWGILYAIGFLLYTAWTALTTWTQKNR